MTSARKLLAAGFVAAALAAGTAMAPAASAAGGGCNTTTQNGWNVGVCSSDNGVRVSGDLYVNRRGSLGSTCIVKYGIWDENLGGYVQLSPNQSCYLGRHPEIHAPKVPGHRYVNVGIVYVNGAVVFSGESKTTT